jgi:shikimate kinase
MAAGKSTVGRELAHRLGWRFLDIDTLIESGEGKSVPAIFRDHGEAHFRRAETSALRGLLSSLDGNAVVALGGGAFLQDENRQLLDRWPTVFLDALPDELWRRCGDDPTERPLRKDRTQFERLYHERLPFYRKAMVTIDTTNRDVHSICAEIEATLHLAGSEGPKLSHSSSRTGEPR